MQHYIGYIAALAALAALAAIGASANCVAGQYYQGYAYAADDGRPLPSELREYRGLSNIRDGEGRNVRVDIRFPPSERRTDVAAGEAERAAAMPLTGRCMLR